MMASDIFRQRIEAIKECDKKLKSAISQTFEKNNMFLSSQDSRAFPADWVYEITKEHLRTLFLSVMDEDVAYKHVIEDWDESLAQYEEALKVFRQSGLEACNLRPTPPDEGDCDRFVLDAEIDYYYTEREFGGEVVKDGETFNLSDPEDLYNYLRKL